MWIYLLKFSALLAIFLLFYKIFLEKATMHQFKRFYLMAAFLIALGIPAITFTEYVMVDPQPVSTEIAQAVTLQSSPSILKESINYLPWILWGIYALGVALFAIKFLINLTGVIKRIKNNPKEKAGLCQHVLLQDPIAPHTFFSYVFFNRKKYKSNQIPQEVFWHEETHAQQKHSLDILLVELFQIIFWFHPLVYISKHFIKLNHEFLADEAVLNKGVSPTTYQKIVLAFSSPDNFNYTQEPILSNSINYSSIKKRIIIMKTHTSKKALWLKSLLLLPLLALLLYSFSDREIVELENGQNTETSIQSLVTKESPNSNGEVIEIFINEKGHLLVNSFFVKMEDLNSFLLRYNQNLTKAQRSQTVRSIITIDKDAPKKVIDQVEAILTEYGVATINIQGRTDADQEKGTTKAEIKEYNALARKYNAQAKGKYVIKTKDVSRIKQLYDRMTLDQKASAEPYPSLPPPPPAPAPPKAPKVIKNSKLPPPPPIPANAPEADRIEYDHIIENGALVEIIVNEDENSVANSLPPSEQIPYLAKEGAKFFLNGDPISSEEAIELTKNNKDVNIDNIGIDSGELFVKLTTKSKKD